MLASAGTIYDENTDADHPASNTTTATESLCPKGWTLPNYTQIKSIGNNTTPYVSSFSPSRGGGYSNGSLGNESTYGGWWSTIADTEHPARRYGLLYGYNGSDNLSTTAGLRRTYGRYIRCVQAS